jgi:hypothetical protein
VCIMLQRTTMVVRLQHTVEEICRYDACFVLSTVWRMWRCACLQHGVQCELRSVQVDQRGDLRVDAVPVPLPQALGAQRSQQPQLALELCEVRTILGGNPVGTQGRYGRQHHTSA